MASQITRNAALAVLLAALGACGLLHSAGAGAGRGATGELDVRLKAAREQNCPHADCVARSTVRGAMAQLAAPEQRAQLAAIVHSLTQDMTRDMVDTMLAEMNSPAQRAAFASLGAETAQGAVGAVSRALGSRGTGPLATTLGATAEQISASTVRGIRGELGVFGECSGADREHCIEERVMALSRAASTGVRDGLRGMVEVPLLVGAFALGLIVALLIHVLLSLRPASPADEPQPTSDRHATAH